MLHGMVPEWDRAKISWSHKYFWLVKFTSDLAFAWLQLLLNFFPSPLANNFWTDLIFYLVSYVAFASMFTRWKVWMHLDKNKSERRKTQVWSFSFSFPWFRCCPVPSAFLSTDFNVFRIAQDLVIRGKEDSRIEFLFSFLNYYFFIILIYYI